MRPVWLRALELARENGRLRRDLAITRLENVRLLRQVEVLSDRLHQRERDNLILARFAHDRDTAKSFLETARDLEDADPDAFGESA